MTEESKIVYRKNGELSTLVGKDAVSLMRVQTIISGLRMNIATGGKMVLTRGATPKRLLALATEYTGKTYKNSLEGKEAAMADLQKWFTEMRDALPQETEK